MSETLITQESVQLPTTKCAAASLIISKEQFEVIRLASSADPNSRATLPVSLNDDTDMLSPPEIFMAIAPAHDDKPRNTCPCLFRLRHYYEHPGLCCSYCTDIFTRSWTRYPTTWNEFNIPHGPIHHRERVMRGLHFRCMAIELVSVVPTHYDG